jgi:hypothetical protein
MVGRPQTAQTTPSGDPPPQSRARPHLRSTPETQGGTTLILGQALLQTIRHFFPDFNAWLDRLPDSRDQDAIVYERRFLAWWGIALYLFQLGSRRQLDFDLEATGTHVLANFNLLAQTNHDTRPVHDTLDHYLGHCRADAFATLRLDMVRRLLRMKALEAARLLGLLVVVVDGTGLLCWHRRHCPECLVQRHKNTTLYLHKVLEAKLLGPAGVVLSVGSEFIANSDAAAASQKGRSAEQLKQDCELKAFSRLAPALKQAFPQARLCLAGDSLFACGRVLALAQDNGWSYVLTFKEGHLPAVWAEFQQLLPLCPRNVWEETTDAGVSQVYRWVRDLSYQDDQGRVWRFHALECVETVGDVVTRFAWLTDLPVSVRTVVAIATKGGRYRWKIENEGFNRQKNSGLNLEHVYSTDPEKWKAYYYLLQIAFMFTQLLERGSLLRRLVADTGKTPVQVFGSLKNIVRRLLESVRYAMWPVESYDRQSAARLHISLDADRDTS